MMRNYEAIFMFYPDADEEKKVKHFDRLKAIIEDNGKISNIDDWGMRKLAYEIEYYKEASYVLVEFEAETESIKELDRVAKILDTVMRHMIIAVEN